MWISGNLTIVPDMDSVGAHLINHSCNPNCAMFPYKGHILIYAIKDIPLGDEFSYNYHFCPDTDNLPKCRCNEPNCRGDWRVSKEECERYCKNVESEVSEYIKDGRISEGVELVKLNYYPKRLVV